MLKLSYMNMFMEWSHTLGPNDMHLAVVFIEVFDYIIPQGFTFGWVYSHEASPKFSIKPKNQCTIMGFQVGNHNFSYNT